MFWVSKEYNSNKKNTMFFFYQANRKNTMLPQEETEWVEYKITIIECGLTSCYSLCINDIQNLLITHLSSLIFTKHQIIYKFPTINLNSLSYLRHSLLQITCYLFRLQNYFDKHNFKIGLEIHTPVQLGGTIPKKPN